jgi:DNA-binding transcriptional regulator YhcF (GntR family)
MLRVDVTTLPLDRTTPTALYLQLAEALAAAIGRGELALGERLPSERDLARRLDLSRTTVVAAYRELESRGLVRGHVGRGTFVVGGADADDEGAPFAWRGKLAAGASSTRSAAPATASCAGARRPPSGCCPPPATPRCARRSPPAAARGPPRSSSSPAHSRGSTS